MRDSNDLECYGCVTLPWWCCVRHTVAVGGAMVCNIAGRCALRRYVDKRTG